MLLPLKRTSCKGNRRLWLGSPPFLRVLHNSELGGKQSEEGFRVGPGDSRGRAANIYLSLAAGEEVLGQDSRTELALPLASWVATRKSLGLSTP